VSSKGTSLRGNTSSRADGDRLKGADSWGGVPKLTKPVAVNTGIGV